jgi:hypothetical protein
MPLDFLARRPYYISHLAPIWNALPVSERGIFYLMTDCQAHAMKVLKNPSLQVYQDEGDCGEQPILTAAYGDAVRAADFAHRPVILMEHGIGLTFGKAAYADGEGQREKFAMMPVQSRYVLKKVRPELAHIPHPIIGIPKLDKWADELLKPHPMPNKPVIGIAFHHGDKNSRPAEVGSAWEHYVEALPELAKRYKLIVHNHPMAGPTLMDIYRNLGLEYVDDFEDVMKQADIYLNDCSSTMYEFLVTGKPVIILNAPWFDRKSNWGIRFWDYANVGIQVDDPYYLVDAIEKTIENPDEYSMKRERAVHDLIPHIGEETDTFLEILIDFLHRQQPKQPVIKDVKDHEIKQATSSPNIKVRTSMDRGVLYMCFGEAAMNEMAKSIHSLRNVGCDLPVAVISDYPLPDKSFKHTFIKWQGESPYDATKANHFQFRAGRVKPFFYKLSPFKETLYLDCDCEIRKPIDEGFEVLRFFDFAVAMERLAVRELYNRPLAAWHHNYIERDTTISEIGAYGHFPFINSGVFFWKRGKGAEAIFKNWSEEWLRFSQWDEQAALLRTLVKCEARFFVLSETWNYPHDDNPDVIIKHLYGLGSARSDVN